ncbi:DNA/RNA non-specific endonuclease [Nocardiopsis akebiae]|uniref:DNA/RNA non-specific endonuclease n=1 Tax=Nocardiopsis akebiae TaxID=2831968 RepID=A0ABX8C487_9ACTN|nr:DNA/RNA non-specific endonuclease [Nocardiopsis akebiae]QUX28735.1 DNA/RNA non-specific endonuclease [Nocardiopsis akebiae]
MPPVDVMSPVPDPRNQQPLDLDFEILIVPDAIPIPGTSVEVLQAAVSAMRTAAGEVAEGGEGIESTWQGLQPHYTAPESETLFAAMGPVAAKGGTILDDVTTVASALDTFADAAQTAKTTLSALKDEATTFAEEMRGDENWSSNPLDYAENRRLKLQVNGVWATFQEAERTCANAISAVSGSGNTYVAASGEAPGAGEIVYGLDPDDVPDVAYDLTSLADWQRVMEDTWHQLEYSEKPWPADWATDAFMAQWDNFGPGMLWDVGVGAVAWTGLWREGSGWADSVGEATDNFFTNKRETIEGLGSLTGLYGEDGWMNPFDSGERSGETWRANAGAAWTEVVHDIVPWREWEDRPAYTVYTGAGNAALAVVSLPARGGTILANLSRGGSGLPDLDPVDRPEVVWEPGAAARPGFSLSQTFSDISGDFSDTTEGFGAEFGDLSAMIERFSAGGSVGGGVPGGVSGGGGGSDLPVFVPEPGAPGAERPVTAPVAGDSGVPGDDRSVADLNSEPSDVDVHRPLDVTTDESSGAASNDRLFSSLGLDAGEIEREYERDVERTTRQVVDTVEEFRALPAERQLEWLRVNQLVDANVGGPQNSDFGGFGNEDFGITASHDPNSGNGGGPPRTPQDGTSNTAFTPGGGGDTDSSQSPGRSSSNGGTGVAGRGGEGPNGNPSEPAQTAPAGPQGSNARRVDEDGNYRNSLNQIEVRYEYENGKKVRNKNNKLVPGMYTQFGARRNLLPGEEYIVFDKKGGLRGEFTTNDGGRVSKVKTYPGESGRWNPELAEPRKDAEYQVEVQRHPGHYYNYETDGDGETVRAYGELRQIPSNDDYRHDEQQRGEGGKGKEYYARDPLKDVFAQIPWNGGHFFGTGFGGSGQTLNLFPQLEWINQNPAGDDWRRNFYAMEGRWREQLDAGHRVEVDMRVIPSASGGPPEALFVRHWIDGVLQDDVYYPNRPPLKEDWVLDNLERALAEELGDIHSGLIGDDDES